MTSDHPFDIDELASAYLDGEATPDERAIVEDDPALQARVEELRVVRDELRLDVTLGDRPALEAALAAALEVYDRRGEAEVEPAASAQPPVDLAAAAAARRRRAARWWKPVAAVAGAAAIGVAAISGVGNLSARDDDATTADATIAPAESEAATELADTARAADGATEEADDSGGATPATIDEIEGSAIAETGPASEETFAPAATMPMSDTSAVVLETTAQLADYAALVADELPATDATTMTETSAASATGAATDDSACAELGLGAPRGSVVWQGTPGQLFLSAAESAGTVATVAGFDCVVLASVPLP